MPRLEIASPDGKRVYDILDPFVTIGRASGNHLQLEDAAIAPVHLRLVQVPKGYRVELADTGQDMAVNGVACAAHVLAPGDRIQIGDTVLTFVAASAAPVQAVPQPQQTPVRKVRPAPEPAAAAASRPARPQHAAAAAPRQAPAHGQGHGHSHGHAHGHGQGHGHEHGHSHGHHAHAKKGNPWVMWVSICALAFIVVGVLMKLMGAGSYIDELNSPDKTVEKAEALYQGGSYEKALDQCRLALLHGPSGSTKDRIDDLTKKIREKQGRGEDQSTLDLAKKSLTAMEEFEQKYLSAGVQRPAAREISRTAQAWLNNYREAVRRYPDTADSADKVQALYEKYSRDAHLDAPDDAADTLFQVDRRLSVPSPLYREALSTLDGYIQVHPNDARGAELYAKRTDIVTAARNDFDRHAAEAKAQLAAHRIPEARRELSAMREAIVARGWDAQADALEREINSAAK